MTGNYFHPYYQLNGVPNIIVDGSPHKDAVLVLSHWKGSGTDSALMRDTSAEIVLDYIKEHEVPPVAVSNDHFDQDGLIGLFALLNPNFALANRDFLVDIAEAGDFAKFKDRRAARVTFTLARMMEEDAGFFAPMIFRKPYPERAAALYEKLLVTLPDIIANLENYRSYWNDEDAFLDASEQLIQSGVIHISEPAGSAMTIVNVPQEIDSVAFHWANKKEWGPVHEMAIHNRSARAQVLYVQGNRYKFKHRYETWVQFISRQHPLRVDLKPLVATLNNVDPHTYWSYSGSHMLTPTLEAKNESALPLDIFCQYLSEALRTSPVDWDPFAQV